MTRASFAICGLALAWAILGVRWLPMADLPQHATQVALWMRHAQVADTYRLNWLTPNLLGYAIARLFAIVLPIRTAMATVVVLALFATPLVVARELAKRRLDPFLAVALVPLGFSMVVYWGLFNFLVGMPLVPLYLGVATRWLDEPIRRRAVTLVALGIVLLLAHVLLFVLATASVLLMVVLQRRSIVRAWPIGVAWPLAIAWLLATREHETLAQEGIVWAMSWRRLVELPYEALGLSAGIERVQLACAALLVLSPLALGARPSRVPWRWAPVLVVLALFFALPFRAFGNACLYPRFGALLAPSLWLALDPAPSLAPKLRALIPLLVLLALGSVGLRLRAFDAEARDLDAMFTEMKPGRSTLALTFLPMSDLVTAPAFDHLTMWYEAEGGGPTEPSFASRYPMLVRYRDGIAHVPIEYDPHTFRWSIDGRFDYYVVRADRELQLPVRLVAHRGLYWLYAR